MHLFQAIIASKAYFTQQDVVRRLLAALLLAQDSQLHMHVLRPWVA